MQKLPSFLQPYLPSYNLDAFDIQKHKHIIITGILNRGGYEALDWLTKTYSKKDIETIIASPTRGSWYKEILQYWLHIFNITIPKEQMNYPAAS